MNQQPLAYLTCLKSTLSRIAVAVGRDPDATKQVSVAERLLDYMIVQDSAACEFKLESFTRMQGLLLAIEEVFSAAQLSPVEQGISPEVDISAALDGGLSAIAELKTLCATADPEEFDRFIALSGDVLRRLLVLDTTQTLTLCKSINDIEADYNRAIEAAVIAHAEEASIESDASLATRNAREYDENALLEFIRREFPQDTDVGIAHSGFVPGGYSKFTVTITLSNARTLPTEIILRADASATFGGASVVEEYQLIKTVYQHGVRVPKPLAVEESGEVFGSKFLLVEKMLGGPTGSMYMLPEPNASVCRDVAEQLAIIHRIPVEEFGDYVDNFGGRSSDKARAWLAQGYASWEPLDMASPVFETAFEWLRRNADLNDQTPRTLVHGDIHLTNMLVHENHISTILDWEFAHIGNPAYDLGYFYDQAVALDSWDAFLDTYGKAGATIPDEDQLNYAILFAATRLGVMTCQTIHAFASGAEPGLAGAMVLGFNFYEMTIRHIEDALNRVL